MSKLPKDPTAKTANLEKYKALYTNFTDKLKRLLNPVDERALNDLQIILEPLADIDPQYPEQVLAFIINGDNPDILLTLHNRPDNKAGLLLGSPGTYSYYYHASAQLTKSQNSRVETVKNTREKLYQSIFEILTPEQIVRYSKFLQAVTQEQNLTHIAPDAPVWFIYLIVDGLVTTEYSHLKKRQNWRIAHLLEVLKADDVDKPEAVIIGCMFERKDVESYYANRLRLIYQLPDAVQFLNAHLELLEALVPTFSAVGQLLFLQNFAQEKPEFVNRVPKLIVTLATSTSKTVRDRAMTMLSQFDPAVIQPHLQDLLSQGNTKQRALAADVLARYGETSREILQHALANETQKSVQQSINTALNRLDSLVEMADVELTTEPFEPIIAQNLPDDFIQVLETNYQELLEKKRLAAEQEIESNQHAVNTYKFQTQQNNYKFIQKIPVDERTSLAIAKLNGQQTGDLYKGVKEIITHKNSHKQQPNFGLHQALRLNANDRNYFNWAEIFNSLTAEQVENLELRQLLQAIVESGYEPEQAKRLIAQDYLRDFSWRWRGTLLDYITADDKVVPFFIENLEFIDEALGLAPSKDSNRYDSFDPSYAINVLSRFPSVPKQYIPKLLEMALGENKTLRFEAQQLLGTVPNIHERAIDALSNGKQEIRMTAIDWLARIGNQAAVKPLYDLLKKEKKEIVIASILTALEALGEDISPYLSPDALLADAEKGLKGKISSSFTWFDLDTLPTVHWKDGTVIDKKIIQWWVVLAEKLKDPSPNGLLLRYLDLLDDKDAQQLSAYLLQSFITEDTLSPSLEEATQLAIKEAPARLQRYKSWYDPKREWTHRYANITLEEVQQEIIKEHLAIYLGSAIKSKGMLALVGKTQGTVAVKMLQDFMKNHYRRTSQIAALLTSFAHSNDPLVIQLLLGVSRRYRTASIQQLAKDLVAQIAERNHWSADELADRTIPTAGLDENGLLTLDFGSRTLTAYVDDKDKFVLKNEDGKVIKALPAARQDDDAELVKEAKTLFSNSKKEFKQVNDLQTARLYEAMCSQRTWATSDWQEYLFAHPIMRRLIGRLVWLEIDQEGQTIQQFRPSDDGSLLNLDDDEVTLQDHHQVKIAHRVLLTQEDADGWLAHFKDYNVKPLFAQMNHELPEFDRHQNPPVEQIEDKKGYVTDTFTLRGVLNKMGYQRASIEDAGSFDRYYKLFEQLGLSAVIEFSGSYVPEENIPAVVYGLSFEKQPVRTWSDTKIPLNDIPPVLLAESYANYVALADATTGFDPDWQSKTLW